MSEKNLPEVLDTIPPFLKGLIVCLYVPLITHEDFYIFLENPYNGNMDEEEDIEKSHDWEEGYDVGLNGPLISGIQNTQCLTESQRFFVLQQVVDLLAND